MKRGLCERNSPKCVFVYAYRKGIYKKINIIRNKYVRKKSQEEINISVSLKIITWMTRYTL